jgi:hypothetical protein
MEWNFTPEEKQHLREYLAKRYAGPIVDEVTGLSQNTRQVLRTRGFFTSKKGDYCFLDLLLGAARKRLLGHGIMSPSAKNPLLMQIVRELLARAHDGKATDLEPSYLVHAPMAGEGAPVEERRMMAGFRGERGVYGYSEGHGPMVIMAGLSAAEVLEHITGMPGTSADSVLVIDLAKMLRTIVAKLRDRGQSIPGQEPTP